MRRTLSKISQGAVDSRTKQKCLSLTLELFQTSTFFVLARTMEHVVTIDRRAPLAFDRTPLSIALEGVRGPRTPFSPERTVVPLPDTNPVAYWRRIASRRIGEAGRDNINNNKTANIKDKNLKVYKDA